MALNKALLFLVIITSLLSCRAIKQPLLSFEIDNIDHDNIVYYYIVNKTNTDYIVIIDTTRFKNINEMSYFWNEIQPTLKLVDNKENILLPNVYIPYLKSSEIIESVQKRVQNRMRQDSINYVKEAKDYENLLRSDYSLRNYMTKNMVTIPKKSRIKLSTQFFINNQSPYSEFNYEYDLNKKRSFFLSFRLIQDSAFIKKVFSNNLKDSLDKKKVKIYNGEIEVMNKFIFPN